MAANRGRLQKAGPPGMAAGGFALPARDVALLAELGGDGLCSGGPCSERRWEENGLLAGTGVKP